MRGIQFIPFARHNILCIDHNRLPIVSIENVVFYRICLLSVFMFMFLTIPESLVTKFKHINFLFILQSPFTQANASRINQALIWLANIWHRQTELHKILVIHCAKTHNIRLETRWVRLRPWWPRFSIQFLWWTDFLNNSDMCHNIKNAKDTFHTQIWGLFFIRINIYRKQTTRSHR